MGARPIPAARPHSLLRFLTCGSVDDGKSTLIGRLLYDAHALADDQRDALAARGTPDFASLVDGLAAEREQGITIDVAYRFFATPRRSFIVADTPGHEQYTRNMATGASTADLAVLLVDARKGVLVQTRRHAYLAHLLGIRSAVLAVNKMDLIDWDEAAFRAIETEFAGFADAIGMARPAAIPLSGLTGANVAARGDAAWYGGPTLLEHLEAVEPASAVAAERPFAMAVQWVNRPDQDFRGFAGTVSGGVVRPGDAVRILPSGRATTVTRIVTMDGDLDVAAAGQAVTLTIADEIDCSRGDVIAAADAPPEIADQFVATIVWMDEAPLLPGRGYWFKSGATTATAQVRLPEHAVDMNTLAKLSVKTLALNDIGVAELALDRRIAFAPYAESRDFGAFILIDKLTNHTVAAGMIDHALRRAQNIHWQAIEITREAHAAQKWQTPKVLWFTGLSGSGKSTIANLVEKKLHALGKHSFLLDGDNVRHGLNRDLGFADADRVENIRRVGEVARLMTDAGLIVLTAFISPFRAERELVRAMLPAGEFVEIFVDTPLGVAEARDVKGLYAKARAGQIANFTGISSPYEPPEAPDIRIDTTRETPEAAAERIVEHIIGVWSPVL